MTPYTPETGARRTSPPCTHARGRGCLWWDPPRTCHNSSHGQYPSVWARACGAGAQVRRGQERARSSQRVLCLLSACGVLALQRSRATLSPLSLPVQSQAGRGCQRYLVQPPAAALGGGQAVSTGQGLSKAPVSAVWKSFRSESEHMIPPFFPRPSLLSRLGHPVVFCFRSLRVRGRGFRSSVLTATCPGEEAETGKTGRQVWPLQAAKPSLFGRAA